jgi:hypothetical protein
MLNDERTGPVQGLTGKCRRKMELSAMQTKRTGFLSKGAKGLLLVLMLITIPLQVSADGPVDLSLGMTGAFPWSVSGIVPGSSDSTFIELHNNGTVGGTLYIWLNNISETDPHGSGNALGNYLYLNVSHPRLSSTVSLPARVYSFPTAPMRADYIVISPFSPGETIRLSWTWEFRETGAPQNDAQEASLRFNISYTLVGLPAPTTLPTTAPTPSPAPVPYYGSSSGGGGGGRTNTFTGPGGPQPTVLPGQRGCENEVSANYTAGFEGLLYNADGNNTLDLDIWKARAVGATITIEPDHIDAYPHESPGAFLRFRLDTSDRSNPTRIVKKVNSAELWTGPLVGNFTTGMFSGSLHAVPTRILQASVINVTLTTCIPEPVREKVRNVSAQNQLELENIPIMMNVTRVNLPQTGAAEVSMTLPASWVEQQGGTGAIHIARISDETGTPELLTTVFTGRDPGAMTFRGDSPRGTGLFVIFSAKETNPQNPEQPGQNNPTVPSGWFSNPLFMGAVLIILLILALILIALYSRRRRQKKA